MSRRYQLQICCAFDCSKHRTRFSFLGVHGIVQSLRGSASIGFRIDKNRIREKYFAAWVNVRNFCDNGRVAPIEMIYSQ
jgi:hypothetical protein